MRRLAAALSGFSRAQDGAAAVELVVVMPLLLLLLSGVVDGGRLVLQAMQVHAAAQAGADFARGYGWDSGRISQAVATATRLPVTATPQPAIVTGCLQSSGEIAASSAFTCPDGGAVGAFVTVHAQAPFDPLMPWPGLAHPNVLTAQSQVRIR